MGQSRPAARPGKVHYLFAPVPQGAVRALRDGFSYDLLAILNWIADRVNRKTRTTTFRLDQLAEAIAWTRSDSMLSKRLQELKALGYIGYESTPGQRKHRYVVSLMPQTASEEVPSANGSAPVAPKGTQGGSAAAVASPTASCATEAPSPQIQASLLSSKVHLPSSEEHPTPAVEPIQGAPPPASLRAAQSDQEKANPSCTETMTENFLSPAKPGAGAAAPTSEPPGQLSLDELSDVLELGQPPVAPTRMKVPPWS